MTKEEQVLERIDQRAAFIQNCANREGTCRSCYDALAMIRIHVNELRALVAEGAGGGAQHCTRAEFEAQQVEQERLTALWNSGYEAGKKWERENPSGGGAAPQWQPIETMPMRRCIVAVTTGEYSPCQAWPDSVGLWTASGGSTLCPQPTHGMPLPLPPSSTREE